MSETKDAEEPAVEDENAAYSALLAAEIDQAATILPAWFVPHMMGNSGYFGLVLTNGTALLIETIHEVRSDASGTIWIDAELRPHKEMRLLVGMPKEFNLIGAPIASKAEVSINASCIMYALEF